MPAGYQRQGAERRHSLRRSVQKCAAITCRGRTLPCKVVDESEGGVRLTDLHIASCPDEFALHVGDDDPRLRRILVKLEEATEPESDAPDTDPHNEHIR